MSDEVRWVETLPDVTDGRVFTFRQRPSTVKPRDGPWYKSARQFEGDPELARACDEVWQGEGWSGHPSSPASFFRQLYGRPPKILYSHQIHLAEHFFGGWQETRTTGVVEGPLFYFDLVNAYRWAGMRELPEGFRPFQPGDDRFVGVMRITDADATWLPAPMRWGVPVVVDHVDVERFGLEGRAWQLLTWDEESTRAWDALEGARDLLPDRAAKRVGQGYWGGWASLRGVEVEDRRGGEVVNAWTLPARDLCVPLAVLIVHRVMRRVWEQARSKCHLIHTDAVLTERPIPTGREPGDWALKERMPEGVKIEAPGVWHPLPDVPEDRGRWSRHSGYETYAEADRRRPELKLRALERAGYSYRGLLTRSLEGYGAPPIPGEAYGQVFRETWAAPTPTGPADRWAEFDSVFGGDLT